MGERLKTHDRMKQWDVAANVDIADFKCALCSVQSDSHRHLFFESPFATEVWNKVMVISNLQHVNSEWSCIVSVLVPLANRNVLSNIIGRLALGTTTYFIWQERNLRIHKKGKRSSEQLFKVIFEMVRCKLLSLKVKGMADVSIQMARWKIFKNVV